MQTTSISYEDLLPNTANEIILEILAKLSSITRKAVAGSLGGKSCLLSYSAGVDSSILAKIVRDDSGTADLVTLGREGSSDVNMVASDPMVRNDASFHCRVERIGVSDITNAAFEVSKIVSVSNLSHFEDCVSFWLIASKAAEKEKVKNLECIVSANGPDELFCGYDRFRRVTDAEGYASAQKEISKALASAEDLRAQVGAVVSKFGYETREPFLEESFKDFCLRIPIEYKILKGDDKVRKRIWRCLARDLGIPDSIALRQKKAMQYGMGIHSVILPMIKKRKIKVNFRAV